MKTIKNRFISTVLCMMFILTSFTFSAFAAPDIFNGKPIPYIEVIPSNEDNTPEENEDVKTESAEGEETEPTDDKTTDGEETEPAEETDPEETIDDETGVELTLKRKVLTISGEGPVGDLVDVDPKKVEKIIIEDGITEIEAGTFKGFENLESVEIADSVKEIGEEAFANCELLEEVVLPSEINTISARTFVNCTFLEEIELPESVKKIGEEAFAQCENLERITIPKEKIVFHEDVFKGCPDGLVIVGVKNSNVNKYANKNGYTFEDIESGDIVVPEAEDEKDDEDEKETEEKNVKDEEKEAEDEDESDEESDEESDDKSDEKSEEDEENALIAFVKDNFLIVSIGGGVVILAIIAIIIICAVSGKKRKAKKAAMAAQSYDYVAAMKPDHPYEEIQTSPDIYAREDENAPAEEVSNVNDPEFFEFDDTKNS